MRTNPSVRLCVGVCLFEIGSCLQTHAQPVIVKGTVSAATTAVRHASVTFEDKSNSANAISVLTDSVGRYQLTLILTSVDPSETLPTTFELGQNYPNPFSSSTSIAYELTTQSDIHVTIYDILGREVRQITVGVQPAGLHSILWDGCNNLGKRAATGTYLYCLQVGGESQARKMVLNAGSTGHLSLPSVFSSLKGIPKASVSRQTSAGTFVVRVENTGTTTPFVLSKQFDNVFVQSDTMINFAVDTIPVAVVQLDSVQQYIRGFGGANILPWRPDMTPDQTQKAFGSGPGQLGFTILRLRIPYTANVSEFAAQVPSAKLAQSLGAIVFASPWTPPPAMKSNNNIVGGVLKDSSYAAYAAHLKGFADYMASNGAPLYAVSLQNEPDANVTYESCSWNGTQFLNFMKNNAAAIGYPVMMPESQNFVRALSDPTLNDPLASANAAIIAGHIYGGGLSPYPLAVSKGKEVWMTEHLELDTSWTAVLATGLEMHNCMLAGWNAYLWWYIVRFYGPILEDGNVSKRGYVMSQFARFVRPGFHKIQCHPTPQRNVYVTTYRDSIASRVVIIVLNTGSSLIQQAFSLTKGNIASFTPYTTTTTKNCEPGSPIGVTNRRFATTLAPSSITTFVSQ